MSTTSAATKEFSEDEVSKHTTESDIWVIIHNRVYDLTKYLEEHPGGGPALLEVAGQDATSAFEDVGHSADARETMEQYLLGSLKGTDPEPNEPPPTRFDELMKKMPAPPPKENVVHHPTGRKLLKLILGGSTLFTSYEIISRLPQLGWLHAQHGGFWRGILISAAASLSVAIGAALYLSQKLSGSEQRTLASYPAHYKPKYEVAPISKNWGWLKPHEYQKLRLTHKTRTSSNTYRLSFSLPDEKAVLGLPIGQHISVRGLVDGKPVSRSYTPISGNKDLGELNLVIKVYPDGQLTGGYIEMLKEGDEVEFRGPKGQMRYRKGLCKHLGMIAGGTGITPMYQIIRAICEDDTDETTVSLLYGNNTEEDILLRKELEGFANKYPQKFKLKFVLSKPSEEWKGDKGYVGKDLIQKELPEANQDNKIFLCGPPGLVNAMAKTLEELGFDKMKAVSKLGDQVFSF